MIEEAINTFFPYKAAGPDGNFAALLQVSHLYTRESRASGVGFLLSTDIHNALIEWKTHSERVITAKNMSCVQCYAPTETSDITDKEDSYSHLSSVISSIPCGDIIIVMRGVNAGHAIGRMIENDELFTEMRLSNNLVIGGYIFHIRRCTKLNGVSPDHSTQNQIDHITISKICRSCLIL